MCSVCSFLYYQCYQQCYQQAIRNISEVCQIATGSTPSTRSSGLSLSKTTTRIGGCSRWQVQGGGKTISITNARSKYSLDLKLCTWGAILWPFWLINSLQREKCVWSSVGGREERWRDQEEVGSDQPQPRERQEQDPCSDRRTRRAERGAATSRCDREEPGQWHRDQAEGEQVATDDVLTHGG